MTILNFDKKCILIIKRCNKGGMRSFATSLFAVLFQDKKIGYSQKIYQKKYEIAII